MGKQEIIWFEIGAASHVVKAVDCTGPICGNTFTESAILDGGIPGDSFKTDSSLHSGCYPDPDNIHERVKQIILIPLTILILASNVGVLIFLAVNKKLHTPAYFLVTNLGIADLLVGIANICTMITKSSEKTLFLCLIRIGFTIAVCTASILCVMCIAIERYIAITYSLKYHQMVTKCKIRVAIVISWFVSLVIGFAPLIGWRVEEYYQYCSFLYVLPDTYILFLFISCVLLPIIIMLSIYGKIYKRVRYHIKRIEAIENLHVDRKINGPLGMSSRTWKSVKTLMTVFGCIILTWLPFILTSVVQIVCGEDTCYLKDIVGTHLLMLGFSNSFLNPLIYAIGTKDFRSKVKNTFRRRS